jgi:gag-polypeptide of LTR copia-type
MDPSKAIANPHFTQLTGADTWRKWKSDIQVVLELNDTWLYVSGKESLPSAKAELDALKSALKTAAYCLKVTCDETNRLIIGDKSDAVAIFAALSATYDGDTPAKRMTLRRRLYHLDHEVAQPMSVYLTTIRTITTELASIGHPLKADEIRDAVLMNLHPSFEVIATILASQDKNGSVDWTIDTLGTQLTSFEESRRVTNPTSTSEMANYTRSSNRSVPRPNQPHAPNDNWLNHQNLPGVCARCGHRGHDPTSCFRDMPQHVKDRIRNGSTHESANAVSTVTRSTPLSATSLLSTVRNGHTIVLYPQDGVVFKGDNVVQKIHYGGHSMHAEDYAATASFVYASDSNAPDAY